MKNIYTYIIGIVSSLLVLSLISSCDVHEWPETPETVSLHLKLNYDLDMTYWTHTYEKGKTTEVSKGPTYENVQTYGTIRYIIRTYPVSKQSASQNHTQEFVITRDIGGKSYDHEVTLDIIPGDYNIMVWSDLTDNSDVEPYHNADNFYEITLAGDEHKGNTDYRDAFRGTSSVKLIADVVDKPADTLCIAMERPLAKYEFISTDLQKFIAQELEYLAKEAATKGQTVPTKVDLENYRVVFAYSGYMPDTYNMSADKPVDSSLGVLFESKLGIMSDNEASLGFDYVFVNHGDSKVAIQIGLYDKNDRQVALSDPITVPLMRSHHTILKGSFMTMDASGGIVINPDFDGNFNIII